MKTLLAILVVVASLGLASAASATTPVPRSVETQCLESFKNVLRSTQYKAAGKLIKMEAIQVCEMAKLFKPAKVLPAERTACLKVLAGKDAGRWRLAAPLLFGLKGRGLTTCEAYRQFKRLYS